MVYSECTVKLNFRKISYERAFLRIQSFIRSYSLRETFIPAMSLIEIPVLLSKLSTFLAEKCNYCNHSFKSSRAVKQCTIMHILTRTELFIPELSYIQNVKLNKMLLLFCNTCGSLFRHRLIKQSKICRCRKYLCKFIDFVFLIHEGLSSIVLLIGFMVFHSILIERKFIQFIVIHHVQQIVH